MATTYSTQSSTPQLLLLSTVALISLFTTGYAESSHEQHHTDRHGDHAHGHGHGHGHNRTTPYTAESILFAATEAVAQLVYHQQVVDGKLLDQTWLNIPKENKHVVQKGSNYFIVRYLGHANRPLYLLLSDRGDLHKANFTGAFSVLPD